MNSIKFCEDCGNIINPDDLSCQNCGKKVKKESGKTSKTENTPFISQSPSQTRHTSQSFYNDKQQYNPQTKKKNNAVVIVLAIVILIFVLGAGGAFFVISYFTKKVNDTVQEINKELDKDFGKKKEPDNNQSKAEKNPDTKSEKTIKEEETNNNDASDVPSDEKIDNKKYPGKYPEGSYRLLNESDLSKYTKHELDIMRNEIYARHGYIFTNQDLLIYFAQQNWYKPERLNVDNLLSKTEKKNIETIKRVEDRK